MKRQNFTFTALYAGIHKRAIKAVPVPAQREKCNAGVSRLRQYIKKSLHGSAIKRTGAAACLAIALQMPALAQQPCNTFQNADAANPILKLLRPGESVFSINFVDIDGDGDLDCYAQTNYYNSFPTLFRNKGTTAQPVFVRDDNDGFQGTTNAVIASGDIQFADLDGDGDYDCFIAEAYTFGGTTIHYFQNTGTPQQPVFVSNEANNPLGFAYGFYGIGFTLADIDGDGDLDVAVSSEFGFYGQTIFRNNGTPTSPLFGNGRRDLDRGQSIHRIYYDWNKDGLPDFFDDGLYYRNIGPRRNPAYVPDATGPQFQNNSPYRFVDLNNDGAVEVFNYFGGYSTLAPVAIINAKPGQTGGFSYTLLTSASQAPGYTYQWKLNGADIPNGKRASYPATRKGSYTLSLTDSCGTGISLPYVLTANAGIQNSNAFIAGAVPGVHSPVFIQALPNPFTNAVTLKIAQPASGGSLIKVCDLQGRVLLTKQTSDATVTVGERLSRGIYMVQVWQSNGLVFSQKLIKE